MSDVRHPQLCNAANRSGTVDRVPRRDMQDFAGRLRLVICSDVRRAQCERGRISYAG
jgi:hypothetical protein